jgi:AraC-like DNA-binding protein
MLLQEGRLSIAATAYESGYGNLSHFNRSFRRMMKTTPGDYRAAMSESSRPRAD